MVFVVKLEELRLIEKSQNLNEKKESIKENEMKGVSKKNDEGRPKKEGKKKR